jgi:hypothetical protein
MPFGRDEAARHQAAKKHAGREHTCTCGRVIRGNAFHSHKRKCAAWVAKHPGR